jgi:hypothetical protein
VDELAAPVVCAGACAFTDVSGRLIPGNGFPAVEGCGCTGVDFWGFPEFSHEAKIITTKERPNSFFISKGWYKG